jgi:hypothetical protein
VAFALTGIEPRRTGRDKARIPATWRGGDGWNVSLDDNRGLWHDFVADEGGGVLDLIMRIRGGSRAEALRWAADSAGVPMNEGPPSPDERRRWAEERRQVEIKLPEARYWKRSAIDMAEEALANLKAALFARDQHQPDADEIYRLTQQLIRWQKLDDSALVAEYQSWRKRSPGLAWAMVKAARECEVTEAYALCRFLGFSRNIADRVIGARGKATV